MSVRFISKYKCIIYLYWVVRSICHVLFFFFSRFYNINTILYISIQHTAYFLIKFRSLSWMIWSRNFYRSSEWHHQRTNFKKKWSDQISWHLVHNFCCRPRCWLVLIVLKAVILNSFILVISLNGLIFVLMFLYNFPNWLMNWFDFKVSISDWLEYQTSTDFFPVECVVA